MTGRMIGVEVLGRDPGREAYRLRADGVVAFVPECLMDSLRPGERPSHQEAYEWIAAHGPQLRRAIGALTRGDAPGKPFDLMELETETSDAR